MNAAATPYKPYTVIIANHPAWGNVEQHASDETQARRITAAAMESGATRASICGPRGWL